MATVITVTQSRIINVCKKIIFAKRPITNINRSFIANIWPFSTYQIKCV